MAEQPEEPDSDLPEDEGESVSEASETADHQGTEEGGADNADGAPEGEKLGQFPLRLTPTIDLSGLIDLPDLSRLLPDLSRLLPDLSAMSDVAKSVIPALDVSGLIPKIDYTSLFPKIELAIPVPDLSAVLPTLQLPDFGPTFSRFLQHLRESLPPNWPHDINLDRVTAVIQDDGLPLVWVPRAEIVTELLAASHRAARVDILLTHVEELVADCREVLSSVSHDTLSGQLPLAVKALDAFEAGHYEAAQALAVTVTETAVARVLGGTYADVKRKVLFDPNLVRYTEMRLRAALAPIGPFYTAWYASSGIPMPEALSRHVSVHQADETHYTRGNAAVAVLLVTSVLRALQELQELAEASEGDEEGA